jgi:hypothetical protein
MKDKNRKIVTQMMEEEMQACHIIITLLAIVTLLTKNAPMFFFHNMLESKFVISD